MSRPVRRRICRSATRCGSDRPKIALLVTYGAFDRARSCIAMMTGSDMSDCDTSVSTRTENGGCSAMRRFASSIASTATAVSRMPAKSRWQMVYSPHGSNVTLCTIIGALSVEVMSEVSAARARLVTSTRDRYHRQTAVVNRSQLWTPGSNDTLGIDANVVAASPERPRRQAFVQLVHRAY